MGGRNSALRLAGAALAVVLTATTVACSSQESADADPVLRVGVPTKLLSVDPHGSAAADRGTLMVVKHVFDPLVNVQNGKVEPALAESWQNVDPTTTRFTLRQGVTFHDGSTFDSADVKASYDRLFKAKTALSPLWSTITAVNAVDERTVDVVVSQPTGALLTNLSLAQIASADDITSGAVETKPVGTGAFRLDSFTSGEGAVLVANEGYWHGTPAYDRLEFKEIPEASSRLTALETGEIDVTYALPPDLLDQVRGFDGVTLEAVPSVAPYLIWFNNSQKPLDDVRVRKALWHAVDLDAVQKRLFGDSAVVAQAPVPQPVFGAAQLPKYKYDPQLAKQLLADAGYPNGFSTSIQWNSGCCPNIAPLVQTILDSWEQIGVKVEMREKESAKWLEDLLALKWDINIQDATVVTSDAEFMLGRLYICSAKRLGYCNPAYDAVMAQAAKELDPAKREQLLKDGQKILWDDAPAIWPFELTATAAWRDRVKGFSTPPNVVPDFRSVRLS